MAQTDQDDLITESRGASADIDLLSSQELVELMNDEDESVAPAVRAASVQIADAIDAIVDRLESGGRLLYVGSGSSGAVAALDASECETTSRSHLDAWRRSSPARGSPPPQSGMLPRTMPRRVRAMSLLPR